MEKLKENLVKRKTQEELTIKFPIILTLISIVLIFLGLVFIKNFFRISEVELLFRITPSFKLKILSFLFNFLSFPSLVFLFVLPLIPAFLQKIFKSRLFVKINTIFIIVFFLYLISQIVLVFTSGEGGIFPAQKIIFFGPLFIYYLLSLAYMGAFNRANYILLVIFSFISVAALLFVSFNTASEGYKNAIIDRMHDYEKPFIRSESDCFKAKRYARLEKFWFNACLEKIQRLSSVKKAEELLTSMQPSSDLIDYFEEVASLKNFGNKIIKAGSSPITVIVAGNALSKDEDCVKNAISQIAGSVPFPLRYHGEIFRSVDYTPYKTFYLFFYPHGTISPWESGIEKASRNPIFILVKNGNNYLIVRKDTSTIESSIYLIDGSLNDSQKCKEIYKGLVTSLGLSPTAKNRPESILNQSLEMPEKYDNLSDIDNQIIKLLYNPKIKSGMILGEVKNIFSR